MTYSSRILGVSYLIETTDIESSKLSDMKLDASLAASSTTGSALFSLELLFEEELGSSFFTGFTLIRSFVLSMKSYTSRIE